MKEVLKGNYQMNLHIILLELMKQRKLGGIKFHILVAIWQMVDLLKLRLRVVERLQLHFHIVI